MATAVSSVAGEGGGRVDRVDEGEHFPGVVIQEKGQFCAVVLCVGESAGPEHSHRGVGGGGIALLDVFEGRAVSGETLTAALVVIS